MESRTLADTLKIARELLAVYEAVAGKKLGLLDGLKVVGQVLATLNAHQVTVAELETLLTEIAPFLPLLAGVKAQG